MKGSILKPELRDRLKCAARWSARSDEQRWVMAKADDHIVVVGLSLAR
jgi:hypothetical protein